MAESDTMARPGLTAAHTTLTMVQPWDILRKDARRLETEIEGRLVDYARLVSNFPSSSSARISSYDNVRNGDSTSALQRRSQTGSVGKDVLAAEQMTGELEALLQRLQSVVDAMNAAVKSTGGASSLAHSHTLQRHTEILHDYNQEFRKTRASAITQREHAELLSGVRKDGVNGGGGSVSMNVGSGGNEALYGERAALGGATSGADSAVSTGLSIKEDLERQRAMFASMVERMETMSEGLPAVNRLIGQIRRKKKRDVLILAAVVSTLLFITLSWKIGR